MVEIIKPGTKNRIECKYCGALLSYQKDDIKDEEVYFNQLVFNTRKYIVCPQCQNKIILEATK